MSMEPHGQESQFRQTLGAALRQTRRGFITVFCISFALNLLMLVSPIYMMQVFDRVLTSGRVETLIMLTLIAFAAIFVLGRLETLRHRVLARIGVWLDHRLSVPVLSASIENSVKTSRPSGEALRHLAQLRGFVGGPAIIPFVDAPWVPFFVLIIAFLHPWLGAVALAGAVALFALACLSECLTRGPTRQAAESQGKAWSKAEGAVRNAEIVQAMGMMPAMLDRWQRDNVETLNGQLGSSDRSAELSGLIKAVRLAIQISILGLGAYLVLRNQLTAGGMIAASILLGRGLAPVEQSVNAWKGMQGARLAHAKVKEILDAADEETEKLTLSTPVGHLSVEGLSYGPGGKQADIIRDVTFELPAGTALAVVGPSASGKSTLCRLITGIIRPTAGAARLDGADVHNWPREQFGRSVGYLPQNVTFFDGTVAENIARMNEPHSEEVIRAAQLADVHDMIQRLPDGYNTPLTEIGPVLSGGQRQRIGLARALYGSPCLIVLDEPNSNLDQAGEAALMQTIDQLRNNGTTVIMVAHRTSVISHVDQLLVLVDGAIHMMGPCSDVIAGMGHRRQQGPLQEAAS